MSEFGFGGGNADPEFGGFGPGNGPTSPDQDLAAPITDADFTLDFSGADPVPVYTPIPAGEYSMMITEATPARAKTGSVMVELTLKVWDAGPFEGRMVKDRLVLPNKEKQTAEKYKKTLDFFTDSLECITGQKWAGETRTLKPQEHLANQLVRAYVTQKPNMNDPNLQHNEIGRYLPKTSAASSSGAPAGFGGFGS